MTPASPTARPTARYCFWLLLVASGCFGLLRICFGLLRITSQVDVVLTHCPPLGHGDDCGPDAHIGCIDLLNELQSRVRPTHHVFGYCHAGYGASTDGQTLYLNALPERRALTSTGPSSHR